MKYSKTFLIIGTLFVAVCCHTQVFAQTQPTKDERGKMQGTQSNTALLDESNLGNKVKRRTGVFPAEVKATNYGVLQVRLENNGESEIKRYTKLRLTFGVVQTRITPLKFVKCLKLKGTNECWTADAMLSEALKPGESRWVEVYAMKLYSLNPDHPLMNLGKELDIHWGYYLNGLPEEYKKDMRLGVKIEVDGGIKSLVTTTPEDFIFSAVRYFPAEIESNSYGVIRVRIQNESYKAEIPKGKLVTASIVPNYNSAGGFTPDCLSYQDMVKFNIMYGDKHWRGNCGIPATKANLTKPIKAGESEWVILNFAWMGDEFEMYKKVKDQLPKILKGWSVYITVEGAYKYVAVSPNHGFWIKK